MRVRNLRQPTLPFGRPWSRVQSPQARTKCRAKHHETRDSPCCTRWRRRTIRYTNVYGIETAGCRSQGYAVSQMAGDFRIPRQAETHTCIKVRSPRPGDRRRVVRRLGCLLSELTATHSPGVGRPLRYKCCPSGRRFVAMPASLCSLRGTPRLDAPLAERAHLRIELHFNTHHWVKDSADGVGDVG